MSGKQKGKQKRKTLLVLEWQRKKVRLFMKVDVNASKFIGVWATKQQKSNFFCLNVNLNLRRGFSWMETQASEKEQSYVECKPLNEVACVLDSEESLQQLLEYVPVIRFVRRHAFSVKSLFRCI